MKSNQKRKHQIDSQKSNNLYDELENRKTQLNDNCRIVHYNQEGVEQLLY